MCGGPAAFGAWISRAARRRPLCFAALAAVTGLAAADWHVAAGFAVVAGLGGLGWRMAGARHGLGWWVCGAVALAVFHGRVLRDAAAGERLLGRPPGPVAGKVLEDAKGSERFWSAPVRLEGPGLPRAKVWWEGRGPPPVAGSQVKSRGSFLPPEAPRNPGEFDRVKWFERRGIVAVFKGSRMPSTVETGRIACAAAGVRHGFREAITAGLDPESEAAQVIRAVVVGERPPDADALIAAFRNSGTLHVFCVSGMHVAMVGSIGWLLLGWLGVARRWAVPPVLALVFGYAWITGNDPPAVRAAWMAAVFLGAFVLRRRPDLLNALGVVLLANLLWDGRLLFHPGVQLSYGVVAAIAVGSALAGRVFLWMTVPELYLPRPETSAWQTRWLRFRQRLAQSLAVSTSAFVGSTPLMAIHFSIVTPVAVVAGVVLLVFVYAILGLALASAALHPLLPPLAKGLNRLNGWTAAATVKTAGAFAAVPGGRFQPRLPGPPRLIVYDLPYGGAAACFDGRGEGAVLIDCGGRRSFRRLVAPSLRQLSIEPETVVLSHPDGEHLGGGEAVWRMFPIGQALLPVERARSPAYRQWLELAPAAGVRIHHAAAHDFLPFPDGASLEIVHHPDPHAVSTRADDRVAVFRLDWRGWKILFISDAGMGTELRLLDAGREVAADVIIAGRHRDDLNLSDPFLDAVDPLVIVASNRLYPPEEALPPATVAYWRRRGIHVMDQAETGAVTLTVDEAGRLVVSGFLGGRHQENRPTAPLRR